MNPVRFISFKVGSDTHMVNLDYVVRFVVSAEGKASLAYLWSPNEIPMSVNLSAEDARVISEQMSGQWMYAKDFFPTAR